MFKTSSFSPKLQYWKLSVVSWYVPEQGPFKSVTRILPVPVDDAVQKSASFPLSKPSSKGNVAIGSVLTVSTALLLVTVPPELLTSQENSAPSSSIVTRSVV
jgi:hypothetical protein